MGSLWLEALPLRPSLRRRPAAPETAMRTGPAVRELADWNLLLSPCGLEGAGLLRNLRAGLVGQWQHPAGRGLRFMLRAAGYSVEAFPSARSFLDGFDPRRDPRRRARDDRFHSRGRGRRGLGELVEAVEYRAQLSAGGSRIRTFGPTYAQQRFGLGRQSARLARRLSLQCDRELAHRRKGRGDECPIILASGMLRLMLAASAPSAITQRADGSFRSRSAPPTISLARQTEASIIARERGRGAGRALP
jgi:hypothetical protein